MSAARPSTGANTGQGRFATSKIVTRVFDEILAEVLSGRLLPGQRISDAQLAERLGVSRTPVREALQRLREIGIIEASASRFTQVADVSPRQTAEAMVVWLALYSALVEEVVPIAPKSVFEAMRSDHEAFLGHLAALDMQQLATAIFAFFSHLVALSQNPTLRKSITSVVHIVRLGSLHLPDYIDFVALNRSQLLLLDAVDGHDAAAANEAMAVLRRIEVPQAADESKSPQKGGSPTP